MRSSLPPRMRECTSLSKSSVTRSEPDRSRSAGKLRISERHSPCSRKGLRRSRMSTSRLMSFAISCIVALTFAPSCTRAEAVEDIPAGTEVTVVTQDGTLVRGKIAKVGADVVTLTGERPNTSTEITRSSIAEVKRVEAGSDAVREAAPIVRTITIPDNTVLDVTLNTPLASDASRVEAPVRGTLASPVVIDGTTAIPSGAGLSGHVTHVDDSDKIKGRAELSFRFTRLTTGSVSYDIDTKPFIF